MANDDPPSFTPFPLNPLERIFHQQNENTKALRAIVANCWKRLGDSSTVLDEIRRDVKALSKEVAILAASQNVTNLNLSTLGSVDRTVREIHLAISKTEIYVGETRRDIDKMQGKVDQIHEDTTGKHLVPTERELALERQQREPENVLAAILLLAKRMPSWLRWVAGLSTSGVVGHLLTRLLHHG